MGSCRFAAWPAGAGSGRWAQLAPSPDAPPVSTAPAPAPEDQPVATLKLNVNLVDVVFTVKDKAGNLVPHLTRDDCTVSEDKEPQTLKSFVAETHQPLTLGILLDTSGSQHRVLPLEQDVGSQFLERVLKPKDEAFLLSFDVNVDLLQDYTNNPRLLARAMNKAEINTAGGNGAAGIPGAGGGTVPTIGTPKGTLLYDAVYLAASQKMNQETGRKAMILLTDGEDEGSRTKINEAIAAAQKSNVIVYTILIADRGFYGGLRLQRLLGHEEDDRGDRRPADRRGQQRQEAGGRLPADRRRAAHPVCGHLHAQQHQAGRRLPQALRRVPRRRHEGAGPQGLFRDPAARLANQLKSD